MLFLKSYIPPHLELAIPSFRCCCPYTYPQHFQKSQSNNVYHNHYSLLLPFISPNYSHRRLYQDCPLLIIHSTMFLLMSCTLVRLDVMALYFRNYSPFSHLIQPFTKFQTNHFLNNHFSLILPFLYSHYSLLNLGQDCPLPIIHSTSDLAKVLVMFLSSHTLEHFKVVSLKCLLQSTTFSQNPVKLSLSQSYFYVSSGFLTSLFSSKSRSRVSFSHNSLCF